MARWGTVMMRSHGWVCVEHQPRSLRAFHSVAAPPQGHLHVALAAEQPDFPNHDILDRHLVGTARNLKVAPLDTGLDGFQLHEEHLHETEPCVRFEETLYSYCSVGRGRDWADGNE
jgi:hypothetical protein